MPSNRTVDTSHLTLRPSTGPANGAVRLPRARQSLLRRWARKAASLVTAAAIVASSLTFAVSPAPAAVWTGGKPITLPFPRLGEIWSYGTDAQIARYDLVVRTYPDNNAAIRSLNPDVILMLSPPMHNSCGVNVDANKSATERPNTVLARASARWALTQVGSTLAAPVSATATTIPVAALTAGSPSFNLFAVGDLIVVEDELMRIDAIGAGSLTVKRGVVFPAAAHGAGVRVASTVQNWPGALVMDITANCPKVTVDAAIGPETWSEWNARTCAAEMAAGGWDGLYLDSALGSIGWMTLPGHATRSIDPDRSNTKPASYSALDAAWYSGQVAFQGKLRSSIGPDRFLIGNESVPNYSVMNGALFEHFPADSTTTARWQQFVAGPPPSPFSCYLGWMGAGALKPGLSMVLTIQYDGSAPSNWATQPVNYRKMRFGLATALLGDGFFDYKNPNPETSGAPVCWFDEYDNAGAGKGYLGLALGPAFQVGSVWRRDFAGGIALVNPTDAAVTVDLGGTFRRIKGTQAPAVNDGSLASSVTLPAKDGLILLRTSDVPPLIPVKNAVYRFYNFTNGTHFYTSSDSERDSVIAKWQSVYKYEGVAYGLDPANNSQPLYRFYNRRVGSHFYTASVAERDSVIARFSDTYTYEGETYKVSTTPAPGKAAVYRFYNKKNGSHFYTASESEKNDVIAKYGATYQFEGPAFWLGQ